MQHMPYERMEIGESPDDLPAGGPARDEPDEEGPKRTPNAAEGDAKEERKMPEEEPGPTPGIAEGPPY